MGIALLAGLSGCATADRDNGGERPGVLLSEQAAAATASLGIADVLGGHSAAVDTFCNALVPWNGRVFSYEQATDLYQDAEHAVRQGADQDGRSDMVAEAAEKSCAARFGFTDRKDVLWAWNEYNLGHALFLFGQANDDVPVLKLAIIASAQSADVFPPLDEGWGWSRYNLGQSSQEIWRLDNLAPYLDKAVTVLRQVTDAMMMPAELRGYAGLRLSEALMDSHGTSGSEEALTEAENVLKQTEQQDMFREEARGLLDRLRSIRQTDDGN